MVCTREGEGGRERKRGGERERQRQGRGEEKSKMLTRNELRSSYGRSYAAVCGNVPVDDKLKLALPYANMVRKQCLCRGIALN